MRRVSFPGGASLDAGSFSQGGLDCSSQSMSNPRPQPPRVPAGGGPRGRFCFSSAGRRSSARFGCGSR
eukprot:8533184-Lingulodinium_polyedra.AAC.1